ncbi:MAG: protein kinase [Deltaproteobacteria bacterium]|nr:protein kinase [Deltaproteobacteria bacterium]
MDPQPDTTGESGADTSLSAAFAPRPFGKYYLLDRIAVGGMAEVFLAKTFGHAGYEKMLVVKRIRERFADDPAFVEMFVDEAKLSAQLVHPNVVQLHDFGKHGKHWFLAMEAVHGQDLKALMRRLAERGERMPVEIAAVIAHQVARGLHYAHTRKDASGQPLNIVHRDVSPSNVLISYEGQVKLVDFGIAKAETTRDESAEAHLLKGKFQYMSPEQTERVELDHRSDVFAAGICLWEMLTGHRLFKREADYEIIAAIRAGNVVAPSEYNPDVPPGLDRICLEALAVDRKARISDAGVLQHLLEDFLLPATPDRLRPTIEGYIDELFAPEIEEERARVDESTRIAVDIHYGSDDLELEEEAAEPAHGAVPPPQPTPAPIAGSGTLQPPRPPEPERRSALLPFLLTLGIIIVAGGWYLTQQSKAPPLASLSVTVQPEDIAGVRMTLDGQPFTSPSNAIVPDVSHQLVINAEGYESRTKTIELTPGQAFATEVVLQPVEEPTPTAETDPTPEPPREEVKPKEVKPREVKPRPDPTPAPDTAGPPVLAFRSNPDGAKVFVDGRPVGKTPLNWENGSELTEYNVEFRMSGYTSVQAVVAAPANGDRRRLTRTLEPKEVVAEEKEPGRLSVQVSSGWAKIYVNGAYVDTTPLFEHSIAPGSYTIRVVNERTGLDVSESVSVRAGEVARKTFRVDE